MKESYEKAIALYETAARAHAPTDRCQCCGALVAEGVKGCWELYSQLLGRAYGDQRYGGATFYGVDAHALQHPELHGKKNNAAHLLRLCWVFERDAHATSGAVPAWWQRYLARSDVPLLAPPRGRGSITVADVAGAASPEEYAALMRRWAEDVYAAWAAHHGWARRELALALGGRK
jgi:hypothetical protein